jgi:hypothetical protein
MRQWRVYAAVRLNSDGSAFATPLFSGDRQVDAANTTTLLVATDIRIALCQQHNTRLLILFLNVRPLQLYLGARK